MDSIIDISLIVPCHNLSWYIKPLLLSFDSLYLDKINVEYIFVLDDCTDNTEDIIRAYMSNINNVQILHCNHHSCGLARNEGLDIAKGEFIWFLDGDDWIIYPYVIRDMLDIMRNENLKIMQLKFVSNFFLREYFSMVWQYIYRKDFIGDTRFTSVQPNEDVIFSKIMLNGLEHIDYYTIPSYFYNYKRPGSNMAQFLEKGKIE